MWVRASCNLEFQMLDYTPLILMLRPRSGVQQWVSRQEYSVSPNVPVVEHTDIFGNLSQRVVAPPGKFRVNSWSEVSTADAMDVAPGAPFIDVQDLPDSVLPYLLPSRYCESDRFGDLAREVAGQAWLGYDQVDSFRQWINETVEYIPGSSEIPLSAAEVKEQHHGVCRDLAHLGIALCRSISIPARLVVGYLYDLDPMDLHAWFEAWVGGRWYTFDPTEQELRGGRVTIAYGRDAADVAVFHQFGPPVDTTMEVTMELLAEKEVHSSS